MRKCMYNKIEKICLWKPQKVFLSLIDKPVCLCFQQNPPCLAVYIGKEQQQQTMCMSKAWGGTSVQPWAMQNLLMPHPRTNKAGKCPAVAPQARRRGDGHKWNWLMHYRAKKFSHMPSFNIAIVWIINDLRKLLPY